MPTATPEPETTTQERKDEALGKLDVDSIVEETIALIEESPIFRAVRTQRLLDGDTEVFDAVFEYTGDPDAPLRAQGTHTTPSTGRIYEYDSTWHSGCVRKIAPDLQGWQYYEHNGWWRTQDNLGTLVLSIPFFSLFLDSLFVDGLLPYEMEWEAFDVGRRNGVLELVLRAVIFDEIDDAKVFLDVLGYTIHIHPEEHPHRVAFDRSYISGQFSAETAYFYDIEEGPVVHEGREDCLSRNSG